MSKKVLITGGTGLLGIAISDLLHLQGHEVYILTRSKKSDPKYKYFGWDIQEGYIEEGALEVDYIIHLAGAGIADKLWTQKRRKEILDSRIESTRLILKYLKKLEGPKPSYIGASAIGIYGHHTDFPIKEEDSLGDESLFLTDVTLQWEAVQRELVDFVANWSLIRIGIVLSKDGGALKAMLIPFKFRLANYFGNGQQIMSWIHIDDLARAFLHIAEQRLTGIYNAVAPYPTTGKELINAISNKKKGPFLKFGVPEFVMKLLLGEMSQTILTSTSVSAEKMLKHDFKFNYNKINQAIADLI